MTTSPPLQAAIDPSAAIDPAGLKIKVLIADSTAPPSNPPAPTILDLVVPPAAFTAAATDSTVISVDHISDLVHPDQPVSLTLHVDLATPSTVSFNYVVPGKPSKSSIAAPTPAASEPIALPESTDVWAATVHGQITIPLRLLVGNGTLKIGVPDTSNTTAWVDLYALSVRTDTKTTIAGVVRPPTTVPAVVTPSTGTLDAVLKAMFPSPGGAEEITWGQNIPSTVPAGRELVLRNADISGREWIIRGLRGQPDKWITIRAETPLGFKVRDLEVWRGIGLYDCQFVRVDGLDGYGSGKVNPDGSGDYVAFVEAVGGHHVAATRNRANNTGGHCISFSAAEGMNAPANAYILYNTALDTSKRNPFNGSAFNLFHGTTTRTPDGPLAKLGYTDYVIGNVAFGCESDVADPNWGITDGNCFILDVGDESGYDGTCLVAFNVGADNGGRGVHELRSQGLNALFNTMVGNQRTLTTADGGEFSTVFGSRHQVRGNIAAATVRNPPIWFQDYADGQGGSLVAENVVLAGSAAGPNNVPVNPSGLGYLRAGSTKSRVVDDYRPKVGTPLVAGDLISRFGAIASVFPDATGQWRKQVICGALDT